MEFHNMLAIHQIGQLHGQIFLIFAPFFLEKNPRAPATETTTSTKHRIPWVLPKQLNTSASDVFCLKRAPYLKIAMITFRNCCRVSARPNMLTHYSCIMKFLLAPSVWLGPPKKKKKKLPLPSSNCAVEASI